MKIIPNWSTQNHVCVKCGDHRSVKYLIDGQPHCNKCALLHVENLWEPHMKKIEEE